MSDLIVTIDGPAGSGKSTVAAMLAKKLCAVFLDTGAMYRAVTLAAMQSGADLTDEDALLGIFDNTVFKFVPAKDQTLVFINDVDVTEKIRTPEVTANAHYIASRGKLRERLVRLQRDFTLSKRKVVTEGRDQGTAVFPDADVKFFLTADLAERAKRRQTQQAEQGVAEEVDNIRQAIEKRDNSDRNRGVGPLKPADDAIIIDTTKLTIEQVVVELLYWVEKKCPIRK